MIVFFVVSNRAGIRTVFPTAVTPFPRMRIDHIFGRSIESLLLAESCPATRIVVIRRTRMDDPRTRRVLHVFPRTMIAIIKMIPGHLTEKHVSPIESPVEYCISPT
jgi:hypothetical protein